MRHQPVHPVRVGGDISIHAPRSDATHQIYHQYQFHSTHRVAMRRIEVSLVNAMSRISIHAPRERCDNTRSMSNGRK